MKSSKLILFLLMLFIPGKMLSQGSNSVEMADVLRSNGKIYVVVLGLVIILTGIVIFLVIVDRKIFRVEKKIEKSGARTLEEQ